MDKNGFQTKLQAFRAEFDRACTRICESETVSRLDVETLQDRMRRMYDFLISFDYSQTEMQKVEVRVCADKEELQINQSHVQEPKIQEEVVAEPIKAEAVEEKEEQIPEEPAVEDEPEAQIEQTSEPYKEEEQKEEPQAGQETTEEQVDSMKAEILAQVAELEQQLKEVKLQAEEPKVQVEEVKPQETEREEPKQEPKAVEAEPAPEAKSEKSDRSSVLSYLHHNIMRDEKPQTPKGGSTLDLFADKTPSIAERFETMNRSDLRTAIGVSEKFMFINDLFSGNLKEYTDFINRLNDLDSWQASKQEIEQTKQKKRWASSSLAYTTLETLIQRRFEK